MWCSLLDLEAYVASVEAKASQISDSDKKKLRAPRELVRLH